MILIFGGAYQGKLDYALKTYGLTEKDVFNCTVESMRIDFDKKIINGLEDFVLACIKEGMEAKDCLESNREKLKDKILICTDISQGIVPMDKTERAWREMVGRTMLYLGKNSKQVVRVFCGLAQQIKASSWICFIRHGITEGNLSQWYYGNEDLPLVDEGKEALKKLIDEGIYPIAKYPDYYTTGLCRTEETLELIYGSKEHSKVEELKEMNFGIYECKSYEALKKEPNFNSWINDETGDVEFPKGESRNQFVRRVTKGLKEIKGNHKLKELSHNHSGKETASIVVCHGGVMSTIMSQLFPETKKNMWEWMPEPGHGYIVFFENGNPQNYEKL